MPNMLLDMTGAEKYRNPIKTLLFPVFLVKLKNSWNHSVVTWNWQTENFWTAVAASIFMPRPPAELDVPTNFDAILKT